MSSPKARLTVTIEPRLLRVAERAVAAGRARSVSSWVNRALEQRVEREERLGAMRQAVESFEREYGEITEAELAEQARADAHDARVVRPRLKRATSKRQSK